MKRTLFSLYAVVAVAVAAMVAVTAPEARLRGVTIATGGSATLVAQRTLLNDDSSSTPTSFPMSMGQGFARAAVPSTSHIECRKSDGVTVITPCSVDARTTWDDGSLAFANIIWVHPDQLTAGATTTIKLYSLSGSYNDTAPAGISVSTITGSHDFKSEFVISGTTYTCRFNNAVTLGKTRTIRSGPAALGIEAWEVLRNGTASNSPDLGQILCKWYVEVFPDASMVVKTKHISGRTDQATPVAQTITSYACKDGATTYQTRVGADFNSIAPNSFVSGTVITCDDDDFQPYYTVSASFSNKLVPKVIPQWPLSSQGNYTVGDSTKNGYYDGALAWFYKAPAAMIAGLDAPQTYAYKPLVQTTISSSPNNPGAHRWLGPLGYYDVAAMLKGTYTYDRDQRIVSSEWYTMQQWFWDPVTGLPANLKAVNYTGLPAHTETLSWSSAGPSMNMASAGCLTSGNTGCSGDASHMGQMFYYDYITHGFPWSFDDVAGQNVGMIGARVTNPRNYTINWGTYNGQTLYAGYQFGTDVVRGEAWHSTTASHAHWIAADSSPLKPYLRDIILDEIKFSNAVVGTVSNWGNNPLGVMPVDNPNHTSQTWQQSFLSLYVGLALKRKQATLSDPLVSKDITLWHIGMATNGCPYTAVYFQYGEGVGQNYNPANLANNLAQTWNDVWIGGGLPLDYPVVPSVTHPVGGGTGQAPAVTSCPSSGIFWGSTPTVPNGYADSGGSLDYVSWGHSSAAAAHVAGITDTGPALPAGKTWYQYMLDAETAYIGRVGSSNYEAQMAVIPQQRVRDPNNN